MEKRKFFLFLGIAMFFFWGCMPPSVMLKRLEKANLEIAEFRRIAVPDFEDRTGGEAGGAAASMLVSKLAEQGYYEVMERSRLEEVMKEHALNLTGAVDEATVKKVGALLGVDMLILGNITAYNVQTTRRTEMVERKVGTGQYEEVEEKEFILWGKKVKRKKEIMKTVLVPEERIDKSGTITIDYRLVEIETARVVTSRTKTASFRKSYEESPPADEEILTKLLTQVSVEFVKDISPHYVERERRLLKGKTKEAGIGIDYAKMGEWDEAIKVWQKSLSLHPGDASTHYNLGLAYEVKGMYEKAEEEYKKATEINPNNKLIHQALAELNLIYHGTPAEITIPAKEKELKPLESIVLNVAENGSIYVEGGEDKEIKVGEHLLIYTERAVTHPRTGEVIGVDAKIKAEVEVIKIFPKMCLVKVVKSFGAEKILTEDKVKRVE